MKKLQFLLVGRARTLVRAKLTLGSVVACMSLTLAVTATVYVNAQSTPPFDQLEALPGGAATTRRSPHHRDAFLRPSANIDFAGEADFRIGNAIFRKVWVSSPSSQASSDGLGPLFNARSCQRCHLKDGRGHPPEANYPDDSAVSLIFHLSVPDEEKETTKPDLKYGSQLQDRAIKGHPAEGHVHIRYRGKTVTLGDGTVVVLRQPTYKIGAPAYGKPHVKLMISPRVAPQMIGLGLLEAIPDADILAARDPDDENGDNISGRANFVWSLVQKKERLGRFGWKAGQPSLRQQSAKAFSGDMGLSTTLFPKPSGDCTAFQTACRFAPNGNSPEQGNVEVGDLLMDFVVRYVSNLAVPRRDKANNPEVLKGRRIFHDLGCARCHTPSWKTGAHPLEPHLSNQTIWPYTDLLLHDLGEGLADHRPEGKATGHEWRTAPLWGIGLTKVVNGHTNFLHDGRARNLTEAVLWHGGEAKAVRDGFVRLSKSDREALLSFLNSL
ncbi:MAG: di-heme oxidoredictase family protein [Hyphomicrobiaceae bacterium]